MFYSIKHAIRALLRAPTFAITALLTIALVVGANTAVFGVLDALLLRRLPVRNPNQLVRITTISPTGASGNLSFPMFRLLNERQEVSTALVGWWADAVLNIDVAGQLTRGDTWAVSGNFFSELGVVPFAGRAVQPDDVNLETLTPAAVAVIGYRLWQRLGGQSLALIGQTVKVEAVPFTIIGVAPPGFRALGLTTEPDMIIPLTAQPLVVGRPVETLPSYEGRWIGVIARLKPGISLEQASAQVLAIWPSVKSAIVPSTYAGSRRADFLATGLKIESAANGIDTFLRPRLTRPLYLLMSIALLILAVACVNLSGLMFSRVIARRQDVAVRRALGAGQWDISRHLLAEAFVVATAGASLGMVFAIWTSRGINDVIFRDYLVPAALDLSVNLRILVFASGAGIVVCLGLAVLPLVYLTRQDQASLLRDASRVARSGRTGHFLLTVQVALSLVLLVNAGLLARSLRTLQSADPGFSPDRIYTSLLFPLPNGYDHLNFDAYFPTLVQQLTSIGGVRSASLSHYEPGSGFKVVEHVTASRDMSNSMTASFAAVSSPSFFDTIGVPIAEGRDLAWTDNSHASSVAILSQSAVSRLFPSSDAIGQAIAIGEDAARQRVTVVGVVRDMRLYDVKDENTFAVYVPILQDPGSRGRLRALVRANGPFDGNQIQTAVTRLGHEHAITLRRLQEVVDRTMLQERVMATLATFFGTLTLLLILVGMYGLVSYTVTQRTREIGIRIALGAGAAKVIFTVLRESLAATAIGIGFGFAMTGITAQLVRSLLFGIGPADTVTLIGAPSVLLGVALLSCLIPTARAVRVNPNSVLRSD